MRYETDAEYSLRRQTAEHAAAARALDPIVRQIHKVLAGYHADRAGAESSDESKVVLL